MTDGPRLDLQLRLPHEPRKKIYRENAAAVLAAAREAAPAAAK